MKISFNSVSLSLIFTILGFVDSIYLTYIKVSNNQAACIQGIGDCWTVNTSKYSEIFGIPVALLGAFVYALLGIILIFGKKKDYLSNAALMAIFGISFTGTIYSIYLTYIEIAVIRALCPFCVVSLVLMTGIFILSINRLRIFLNQS
jgi:uncharacterized membrane protein